MPPTRVMKFSVSQNAWAQIIYRNESKLYSWNNKWIIDAAKSTLLFWVVSSPKKKKRTAFSFLKNALVKNVKTFSDHCESEEDLRISTRSQDRDYRVSIQKFLYFDRVEIYIGTNSFLIFLSFHE